MPLRWGIVGAGKISHDFVCAVQTLADSQHEIVAIAASLLPKAQNFAKDHEIPKAYGSYYEIGMDSDVDVVYIGLINSLHFEVSKMMLELNKHVLCETPLTINEKQTRTLIEYARTCNLFLMEGVWSRCFLAYKELTKILDSGSIGEVIQISVMFGYDHVARPKDKLISGGTILDLGVFLLQFQQLILKKAKPIEMYAVGGLNQEGTDDYTISIWKFPGDKVCSLTTSARAEYPNHALIIGTNGFIRIPTFWCPTIIITPNTTYNYNLPKSTAEFNYYNSVGLSYEAEHVRECINNKFIESPLMTHEESIQLACHMDMIRQRVGVVFEEDEV